MSTKRSPGRPPAGPSPHFGLPEPLRSCPSLRLDVPALEEALLATSDAYASVAALEPVPLSSATLIVVPSILIDHWSLEIAKHVRPGSLRVYFLESGKDADIPAHRLAWDYDVVMTTFSHLSSHGGAAHLRDRNLRHVVLQVHWLRVILDEGHSLGRSTQTNRLAVLSAIRAERRWVMTGTPVPHTAQSRVSPLLPLFGFLRCQPYHGSRGGLTFDAAIRNPFEAGRAEGKERLMEVLRRIMIRSSKAGVTESLLLPKCTKTTVRLKFDPVHQESYNALVETIMRNLLLADWFDEGHRESLLHPKRSKPAAELLTNMRLACSVAGQTNFQTSSEDVFETLNLIAQSCGYPEFDGPATLAHIVPAGHPLARIETTLRHGGTCDACSATSRIPMVTPCAHVLCVDCTVKSSLGCCVCGTEYTQQGVDDPGRRLYNSNPRAPVPINFIELQPAFHQLGARGTSGGSWQPQWQATRSTKCDYLVRRLRELGIVPPPPPPDLPHWEEYVPPPAAEEAAEEAAVAAAAAGPTAGLTAEKTEGAPQPPAASSSRGGSAASAADGCAQGGSRAERTQVREVAAECVTADAERGGDGAGDQSAASHPAGPGDADRQPAQGVHAQPPGRRSRVDLEEIEAATGAARDGLRIDEAAEDTSSADEVVLQGAVAGPSARMVGDNARMHATMTVATSAQDAGCSSADAAGVQQMCGVEHGAVRDGHACTAASPLSWRNLSADVQYPPEPRRGQQPREREMCDGPDTALRHVPHKRRVTFVPSEISDTFTYAKTPDSCSEDDAEDVPDAERSDAVPTGGAGGEKTSRSGVTWLPGRLPCLQRGSPVGSRKPASILRKHSSFPRPGDYGPGPLDVFTPPPLCPKPQRSRRRGRRALLEVEGASDRRAAQHGGGTDGVRLGGSVLGSVEAAAGGVLGVPGREEMPVKAIVYCAFWHHLMLVEKHLADSHAEFVVLKASMGRAERARALAAFRHGGARVLLMDAIGAVGLDLSFVQYVFLMEPLGDLALEQQIVSRAHRLGATRAVHAEVLVMQGSIEDDLVSVANGEQTQKLQEASGAQGTSISRCQAECWAKMEGQADGMGRPMRNLLLTSLKRVT